MAKKILLADDSITIQKVVELTFSDGDYEVTAVNNGAKAIQKLSEMRPDIILSDIIMPEKNGYEVCEFVKSHPEYRTIPVVLLTGTFEPFDPDRADKAGCDAVVTKPFESQSLIHKVEELIDQARASAPAPAPAPAMSAAPPPPPPPPAPAPPASASATPTAPTPSPWMEEPATPPPPPPPAPSPFTPAAPSGGFTHDSDIFGAGPEASKATVDMPFAANEPFGAPPPPEQFSGETRAFPKMSFDTPPPPAAQPASAPEPSPWDSPAMGGETRAFPKMSFEDMKREATPPPPPPPPLAMDDYPFGAPPPAEQFSGETRAFPKMSFEDLEKAAAKAPAIEPEPEPEPAPAWPAARTEPEPVPGLASFAPAPAVPEPVSAPERNGVDLTDEQVDRIARRVVQLMSDQVVRNIAWEVIPDLAEMVVKERIKQLETES
jgi:CheY-like chemotaxis protein